MLFRSLPGAAEAGRLLIITIPDFSVTPNGRHYGSGRDISTGIAVFNAIITEEAKAFGLDVADIYPSSKAMGSDPSLVSADGLHPSATEYAKWESLIYPFAFKMLAQQGHYDH